LVAALHANSSLPTPPHLGPRQALTLWADLGADKTLIQALSHGIRAPISSIPPPRSVPPTNHPNIWPAIQESLQSGTIRELSPEEISRTKTWVPTFHREKKNGKIRLITDLRELNKCTSVPRHKADTWNSVLENLQEPNLRWALTLDLRGYYHHLEIHKKTQRWMRFRVGDKAFQIISMPFGWSLSPWWAHKLAQPIRAWLNDHQWCHNWWVDDILLLGETKQIVEDRAVRLINLLTKLGIHVNSEKSMKAASQTVIYVGHELNLEKHKIFPLPEKSQAILKLARKQGPGKNLRPKDLASLAGAVGDAYKSNISLHGLQQQLMRQAALGVAANQKFRQANSCQKAWTLTTPKSQDLHTAIQDTIQGLRHPTPRTFRPSTSAHFTITTDASDKGWGAQILRGEQEINTCAQKWEPQESLLHITQREALATALAVQTLLPFLPPRWSSDNSLRRHQHNLGVEEGLPETAHEHRHSPSTKRSSP
jgi:hypothetical protein